VYSSRCHSGFIDISTHLLSVLASNLNTTPLYNI